MIYVGKAKSLRSRLTSYFADISGLAPRTRQMVMTAGSVEWTVVNTEVEALQLEYNWIKEFDPRFNVRYRDDKSYPVLAVTLGDVECKLLWSEDGIVQANLQRAVGGGRENAVLERSTPVDATHHE